MKRLRLLIFLSLVVVVFLNFMRIDIWDADFWWHIATGRQIVTAGALPDKDVLSYSSELQENKSRAPERESFILKQYWAAQVLFYFLFNNFGSAGIIALRSLLFSLLVLFVLLRLHRWSVSTAFSFLAGFGLFMMLVTRLTGDRPVLFTYLFPAIIFFVLEEFRQNKGRLIFLLPALMLLWANLHGGFIIGVLVIAVYMTIEGLKIALKKTDYTRDQIIRFYLATSVAIGISFLNPCGWNAFLIAVSNKYNAYTNGVQEYDSPYLAFFKERLSPVDYWYLGIVTLFPVVLILRKKKFDFLHLVLLSGFFVMSLSALRFVTYYEIFAVMILGREFDTWLKDSFSAHFSAEGYKKAMNWLTAAVCISFLIFMSGFYATREKRYRSYRSIVPTAAVDFVRKNRIPGEILNDYSYGGYLGWTLYPWKKQFIDTRGLNLNVMLEYNAMVTAANSFFRSEPSKEKGPLWDRLLDHYKMNIVFLGYHDIHGTVYPLIFRLLESDRWVAVYCDPMAIIFVRNVDQNNDLIKKFGISKDTGYQAVIYSSAFYAMVNTSSPKALISLGETFYEMGRFKEALTAYRYAIHRLPNKEIEEKIKLIETKLKSTEKSQA